MSRKLIPLILFLFALPCLSFAQTIFGNEWINYSQTYLKIKLNKDGIYTVQYNDLKTSGLSAGDISAINPKNFQLFYRGVEVPIYVTAQNSNQFGQNDHIEFLGRSNDGALDKDLYKDENEHTNPNISLMTDTSTYFLTWTAASPGLRYQDFNKNNYSAFTAESYYIHTEVFNAKDQYIDGVTRFRYTEAQFSDFNRGEGMVSLLLGPRVVTIPTTSVYTSGPNANLYINAYGRSYDASQRHHFRCSTKGSLINTYTQRFDTVVGPYDRIQPNVSIPITDLDTSVLLIKSEFIGDLGQSADFIRFSHIVLNYPRVYSANNLSIWKWNFRSSASESYIHFSNYNSSKSKPFIFDETNGIKISGSVNGGSADFIIPSNKGEVGLYLSDETDYMPINHIEKITFKKIDTTLGYDFLIVSNKKLAASAKEYADYRKTKNFNPLLVYSDELYDQFFYGLHSPLAIRHFCDYMLHSNRPPTYLLLLGRGIQLDAYWTYQPTGSIYNGYINADLVPTWGLPASDILLTAGLGNTRFEPAIATGRLAASSDEQVRMYLEKLKYYEIQSNSMFLWKKNMLHMVGGRTEGETNRLKNNISNLTPIAEGDSLGMKIKGYYKYDALPVTTSLANPIQTDLKSGQGFTYYYGHGAADILEINIGDSSDLDNQFKMPVMMFAGCILGNCYRTVPSLGERWIFTPKKVGSIAWIANSWYGFEYELSQYAKYMYNHLFKESYGESIGNAQIQAIRDFQATDPLNQNILLETHCKQTNIQGDPALKLYSPRYPDFLIAGEQNIPSSLNIYPSDYTTVSDSIAIKVTIYNKGKTTNDSINIKVVHTLPDNITKVTYPELRVKAPAYSDDYFFWLPVKGRNLTGNNRFLVEVNPSGSNRVNENSAYANNGASIDLYIPSNTAEILFPYKYSIEKDSVVKLMAQSVNSNGATKTFIFEIDTNYQFKSAWLQSKQVTATQIASTSFKLIATDSTVYYWRVRLKKTIDENESWKYSSFTYIKQSYPGWAQAQLPQTYESDLRQLYFDTVADNRSLEFNSRTSNVFWIFSAGANYSANPWQARLFRKNSGQNMNGYAGGNIGMGIGFVAINPNDETVYQFNSKYNVLGKDCPNCAVYPHGIMRFEEINPGTYIDTLVEYIKSIPDGYRVFCIKGTPCNFDSLTSVQWSQLNSAFISIGGKSNFIRNNVKDSWPYLLKGTKGVKGSAREQTAVTKNNLIAPEAQLLQDYDQLGPRFADGSLSSELVGPSRKWMTFYHQTHPGDTTLDSVNYRLTFYSAVEGVSDYTTNYIGSDSLDISNISADTFPTVRISMNLSDPANRTPLQPKYWIINYNSVPEGSVINGNNLSYIKFPADTLPEGDSASFSVAFTNISRDAFDSVLVNVSLTNNQGGQTIIYNEKLKPLLKSDTIFYTKKFTTSGLQRANKLTITFNPNMAQPEQYLYNNVYEKKFYVTRDFENPLLDVTFDGIKIFNGDIVSANPYIRVAITDENKNGLINDTSLLSAYITYPGGGEHKIIYNDSRVKFTPADAKNRKAELEFNPEGLPDGEYKLRANGKDIQGNAAGNADYQVTFKVNSKPSISHFYPYPNPFTTKAKFVFNLTGAEVPDQLRIQIMTVSGIVVKEIFKEELGNIHIGTNVTEYAWDGTDQFGEKLANGVYLYKVTARLHGKDIALVSDDNDIYFKRGVGKIVIMR
jgi:hypothetical protein